MDVTAIRNGNPKATSRTGAATAARILLRTVALAWAAAGLVACAGEQPQSTVSPQLDSGVTSSNGGGTRALGNQPRAGVTTPVRP